MGDPEKESVARGVAIDKEDGMKWVEETVTTLEKHSLKIERVFHKHNVKKLQKKW